MRSGERRETGSGLRAACAGASGREKEQGFLLLGLVVAIFFVILALSIAAPTVAKHLQREREVEAMHRGNQYVRAIQLYYRKTNTYPAAMDALGQSNNIRYLRQQYVDPMTGKADWRLIHVGEAKTTVKGFFGKPLAGLAPGLGTAAGLASPGAIGAGAAGSTSGSGIGGAGGALPGSSAFGSPSGPGGSGSSAFGSSSFGSSSPGSSSFGSSSFGSSSSGSGSGTDASSTGGTAAGTDPSAGTSGSNGAPGQTAGTTPGTTPGQTPGQLPGQGSPGASGTTGLSALSGGGSPFVGVGLPKHGDSIVVLNEQKTYQTWEFIYDPRIEQMKSGANILGGGGPVGGSSGGLGSASSFSSGIGGPGNSGTGNSPSGFGSGGFGNNSGFGSSPAGGTSPGSSGFGSSGFGSSGTGPSGSSGSTPQSNQPPQ